MRTKRTSQISIFDQFAQHDIGRELASMSAWLDSHVDVLEWVARDLRLASIQATGRRGMSAESVLRCALLKQHRQLSYEELAFHLLDSASFQSFARLPVKVMPRKSALQSNISVLTDATWGAINQHLLEDAKQTRVETGRMLRIDSTVTDTPIHEPSDSTLLWDAVRILVRLMRWAEELSGVPELAWCNHSRVAKKRARTIRYTRGKQKKVPLYKDLVRVTEDSLGYVRQAQVMHYTSLIERVIEQIRRRVFAGEKVAATDKILSVFEEHTDFIVKGAREIQYGHKLNLSSGRSGLILDVVIEQGNPADAGRFLPMVDRHIALSGCVKTNSDFEKWVNHFN